MQVSALYYYPLKSGRGIPVEQAQITQYGLHYDRRWLVVDTKGRFLTQRRFPQMALLQSQPEGERLSLQAPGRNQITALAGNQLCAIRIWGFNGQARDCGDAVAAWLSDFLHHDCRLVMADEKLQRPVPEGYGQPQDEVQFADAFPFLLISQSSLDGLNNKLNSAVTMDRFRPNIVIEGCADHAEDDWQKIRIGEINFAGIKLCERCTIPTVNQSTGSTGEEPTKTLSTYRRDSDGKIHFGQNLIHQQKSGILRVGDKLEILA